MQQQLAELRASCNLRLATVKQQMTEELNARESKMQKDLDDIKHTLHSVCSQIALDNCDPDPNPNPDPNPFHSGSDATMGVREPHVPQCADSLTTTTTTSTITTTAASTISLSPLPMGLSAAFLSSTAQLAKSSSSSSVTVSTPKAIGSRESFAARSLSKSAVLPESLFLSQTELKIA